MWVGQLSRFICPPSNGIDYEWLKTGAYQNQASFLGFHSRKWLEYRDLCHMETSTEVDEEVVDHLLWLVVCFLCIGKSTKLTNTHNAWKTIKKRNKERKTQIFMWFPNSVFEYIYSWQQFPLCIEWRMGSTSPTTLIRLSHQASQAQQCVAFTWKILGSPFLIFFFSVVG